METSSIYLLMADLILLLHTLIVAFVIFGLLLVLVGKYYDWHWVRNPWFRLIHLVAIGMVVIQSWLGVICPLTVLEMTLRSHAGDAVYTGSFIAHWLGQILYYRLPAWVFVVVYTLFGSLVVASWFWVRPRSFSRNHEHLSEK
jgi:hypothetical protein